MMTEQEKQDLAEYNTLARARKILDDLLSKEIDNEKKKAALTSVTRFIKVMEDIKQGEWEYPKNT